MAAQAQADCLQGFEQADAICTAARARILGAFTAGRGYSADADYGPAAWLIHRTKVTKGAARDHLGWARRTLTHPQILAALAEGTVVSESVAAAICQWTGKLPEACRPAADEILVTAARAGARQDDLARLAAEIYARSLPEGEDDPEPRFEDRQVRVETTFASAGVITGDLSPDCAAVVTEVLESLSAPVGAQDTRSREHHHDALAEAMRWHGFCIVTSVTLPVQRRHDHRLPSQLRERMGYGPRQSSNEPKIGVACASGQRFHALLSNMQGRYVRQSLPRSLPQVGPRT